MKNCNNMLSMLSTEYGRFAVSRFQFKSVGSIDVIQECRSYFGIELPTVPSCLIKKRQDKFLSRFNSVDNLFCR